MIECNLEIWCRLWLCKFFCAAFNKGTQPFDFIKYNVIRKLAYKVKYIGEINGDLLMLFRNSRTRSFKMSWFNCEQLCKESIQDVLGL